MNLVTMSLILFAIMILLAVILLVKEKPWVKREDGHWLGVGLGMGMGMGMPIGLLIGISMDNVPVGVSMGPALGAGMGIGIGTMLEKKYRDTDEPLSEEDQQIGKWFKKAAVLILLLGIIILGVVLMAK